MDLFLLVVTLSLSYLLVVLFSRSRIAKRKNHAPQAAGAWPIIGHLPLFKGPKHPYIALGEMAEKYGPIYGIRIGVHQGLVVSSWETAKEIFTNHDLAISSRLKLTSVKHLGYDDAMFAVSPYSPYWLELRKIVVKELLRHVRVSTEVETSLKELYKLWADKKKSTFPSKNLVLVEMKEWFGDLIMNVILKKVIGKGYFGAARAGGNGREVEEFRRCQEVMGKYLHLLGVYVMKDTIPFLGFIDFGGKEKSMKETAKELDNLVSEWLREHKEKRAMGGEEVKQQDFMDVLLSVVEALGTNPNLSSFDADTIINTTCMALIAGGRDSPTVTLVWALSLLLNNRHCLKKVQEELDIHVGKGRLVNDSDVTNLKYLQAVVKETMRLIPPVPMLSRICTQDFTLNNGNGSNYHVSKGTWVFFNAWKIQTDPKIWLDPYEFKPERFLTSHKDVDIRGQHFEVFPFGCGRRMCVGSNFGLQMVNLALAGLLQAFEISTPSNERVDMTGSAGISNMKATPLEVLISPRLPSEIYG